MKATETKKTKRGMKLPRLEFDKARNGEWFWRFKTRNGRIVGGPGRDSYKRLQGATRGFDAVAEGVGGVTLSRNKRVVSYDVFVLGVKQ